MVQACLRIEDPEITAYAVYLANVVSGQEIRVDQIDLTGVCNVYGSACSFGDVCGDFFSSRRVHWSSSALGDKSDRNVDNGVQPSDEKSKGLEEMRQVASLVLPWNERQHCTSQMFAMFV